MEQEEDSWVLAWCRSAVSVAIPGSLISIFLPFLHHPHPTTLAMGTLTKSSLRLETRPRALYLIHIHIIRAAAPHWVSGCILSSVAGGVAGAFHSTNTLPHSEPSLPFCMHLSGFSSTLLEIRRACSNRALLCKYVSRNGLRGRSIPFYSSLLRFAMSSEPRCTGSAVAPHAARGACHLG